MDLLHRVPARRSVASIADAPPRLWVGLALAIISCWVAWFGPAPYSEHTFFPLWLGYILAVDGLTMRRAGTSLFARDQRRLRIPVPLLDPSLVVVRVCQPLPRQLAVPHAPAIPPGRVCAASLAGVLDRHTGHLRDRGASAHISSICAGLPLAPHRSGSSRACRTGSDWPRYLSPVADIPAIPVPPRLDRALPRCSIPSMRCWEIPASPPRCERAAGTPSWSSSPPG